MTVRRSFSFCPRMLTIAALAMTLISCAETTATTTGPGGPAGTTSAPTAADFVAHYKLTFDADWSASTHPEDFPGNPHFSGLVGASHNLGTTLFSIGLAASDGIRDMAETGAKAELEAEMQPLLDSGDIHEIISGAGVNPSPGSVSLEFEVTVTHPRVTVVSMIAPSPDWFVGVQALALHEDDAFVAATTVTLFPIDAGTDDGGTYTANDEESDPQELITPLLTGPVLVNGSVVPLGTFTFERLD